MSVKRSSLAVREFSLLVLLTLVATIGAIGQHANERLPFRIAPNISELKFDFNSLLKNRYDTLFFEMYATGEQLRKVAMGNVGDNLIPAVRRYITVQGGGSESKTGIHSFQPDRLYCMVMKVFHGDRSQQFEFCGSMKVIVGDWGRNPAVRHGSISGDKLMGQAVRLDLGSVEIIGVE